MWNAKSLFCDHKNPYFSENIRGRVFCLIWCGVLMHALWERIINRLQLVLLVLVYFSFPSSSLPSDFCHFFPSLSLSVPLEHPRVVWKILSFVSSHSYVQAYKLILSFDEHGFIILQVQSCDGQQPTSIWFWIPGLWWPTQTYSFFSPPSSLKHYFSLFLTWVWYHNTSISIDSKFSTVFSPLLLVN